MNTKKSLLLPNRRAFYAQKRCKNVHTPSINTTTTSLNREGVFFVCNTWCGDIEPENLAIATHINWETYVSKRLISSNKEFLTKPSIYESYGSVY